MVDTPENAFKEKRTSLPPVKICNLSRDKECSERIYNRNIPLHENNINVLDYRGSYMVCKNYTDLHSTMGNEGNYPQKTYAKNIDIESNLRYTKTDPNPSNKRNDISYGEEYQRQFELLKPKYEM